MEVRALTCLVLTKRADSEGLGRKGERKRREDVTSMHCWRMGKLR